MTRRKYIVLVKYTEHLQTKSSYLTCNLKDQVVSYSGFFADDFQAYSKDRNFRLKTRNTKHETR